MPQEEIPKPENIRPGEPETRIQDVGEAQKMAEIDHKDMEMKESSDLIGELRTIIKQFGLPTQFKDSASSSRPYFAITSCRNNEERRSFLDRVIQKLSENHPTIEGSMINGYIWTIHTPHLDFEIETTHGPANDYRNSSIYWNVRWLSSASSYSRRKE